MFAFCWHEYKKLLCNNEDTYFLAQKDGEKEAVPIRITSVKWTAA